MNDEKNTVTLIVSGHGGEIAEDVRAHFDCDED